MSFANKAFEYFYKRIKNLDRDYLAYIPYLSRKKLMKRKDLGKCHRDVLQPREKQMDFTNLIWRSSQAFIKGGMHSL